jgi:hypothetical protein
MGIVKKFTPMPQKRLQPKPKPKRRAPNKPANGLKTVVRTPGSIIRTLQKTPKLSPNLSHYVTCRTNPFHGHGGSAIPDGKNSNFVVTDTFSVNNFSPTAAGQTIVIQTLNALPALSMIGSTTNFIVDGVTVTALGAYQPSASTAANSSWYPTSMPPPMVGTAVLGANFMDPYNAATARMISVGYRLIYTGPATTCSGAITVTPNPIAWGQTATSATGNFQIKPPLTTGTPIATALPAGTVLIDCDITINPTAMTRATKTFRPEQGVYVVPTHRSTNYAMQPTYVCPLAPVPNLNLSTGAVDITTLLRVYGGGNPGIVWFDNDWTTYSIVLTGLNADASFRLETVLCMEYNPAISSAFYPLSIKQSPTNNNDIKVADDKNKNSDIKSSS